MLPVTLLSSLKAGLPSLMGQLLLPGTPVFAGLCWPFPPWPGVSTSVWRLMSMALPRPLEHYSSPVPQPTLLCPPTRTCVQCPGVVPRGLISGSPSTNPPLPPPVLPYRSEGLSAPSYTLDITQGLSCSRTLFNLMGFLASSGEYTPHR